MQAIELFALIVGQFDWLPTVDLRDANRDHQAPMAGSFCHQFLRQQNRLRQS